MKTSNTASVFAVRLANVHLAERAGGIHKKVGRKPGGVGPRQVPESTEQFPQKEALFRLRMAVLGLKSSR